MTADRRWFLRLAGCAAAAAAGAALGCSAAPAARRRLAMAVDLDRCKAQDGCRACVKACHGTHNVPAIPETRHEVKWIWPERFERAMAVDEPEAVPETLRGRPVPVFCNHCDNPPCVRVCPTQATWARDDGIVTIDAHRCIGCRYCIAACPYGSRSFNWIDPRPHVPSPAATYPTRTQGVVEKCNFCEDRLAAGRIPACVDACPERALVFGDALDPSSDVARVIAGRFAVRRRPELGTRPQIHYLV